MILGVGTDLVEIDRMRKACEKEYFVSRTFTEAESRQAGGSASKLRSEEHTSELQSLV